MRSRRGHCAGGRLGRGGEGGGCDGLTTATLSRSHRESVGWDTLVRRESATADIASGGSMRLTILALNFSEYRTDEPPRPLERWLPGGATVNGRGDNYADTGGEGLDETLTVKAMGLPEALERTLSTTNPIENLMGSIRALTRRVRRWRGGEMIERWVAVALQEASKRFHRVRGSAGMKKLAEVLDRGALSLVKEREAA
jgi:hypothetical protein